MARKKKVKGSPVICFNLFSTFVGGSVGGGGYRLSSKLVELATQNYFAYFFFLLLCFWFFYLNNFGFFLFFLN